MKKTFALLCFLALCISPAIAQETPKDETTSQEAPKHEAPKQDTSRAAAPKKSIPEYETNASYAFRRFTEQNSTTLNMNGWAVSGVRRWRSWINAEVAFSGAYGRTTHSNAPSTGESIYTAFAGPRFYFPGQHKLTPFIHLLLGEGLYRRSTSAYGGYNASVYTDLGYAWEFGGGMDLTVGSSGRWAVRLFQFDTDQTRFMGNYTGQTNLRFSTGITYRFGTR